MIYYVKHDSIKFLVSSAKFNEAREMIKQVYDSNEHGNAIIDHIEMSSQKETSSVSLKDAITSPHYRRATFVALMMIVFHELTGENAIMLYSTEIFKKMSSYKDGYALEPRTGTILIGVFNLLAHIPAIYLIKLLPRRILLVTGHLIMAACHILVGAFAAGSDDIGVIVMMIIFITTYVITTGPIIWLYVSEIVVDSALGVCLFTLWSMILLLSLFTNVLMESFLRPEGVFWIFGISSLFGAWFNYNYVKETSTLSDRGKKSLYMQSMISICRNTIKEGGSLDSAGNYQIRKP